MRPLIIVLALLLSSTMFGKGTWDEKSTSHFLKGHGYSASHHTEIALIIPYQSCAGNSQVIFDFLRAHSKSPIFSILHGTTQEEVARDPIFQGIAFSRIIGKRTAAKTLPDQASTIKVAYIYNSEVRLVEPLDCNNFASQSQKMTEFLAYGQQLMSQR